ncbi:hypothetical protein [Malaciobacter mytili]|nr:hypothetical protein [Malaciobacter mytili]
MKYVIIVNAEAIDKNELNSFEGRTFNTKESFYEEVRKLIDSNDINLYSLEDFMNSYNNKEINFVDTWMCYIDITNNIELVHVKDDDGTVFFAYTDMSEDEIKQAIMDEELDAKNMDFEEKTIEHAKRLNKSFECAEYDIFNIF